MCPPSGNFVYEGTAYLINTQKFFPIEETNYTYDQDNAAAFSATVKGYKYNVTNGQLSSRTFSDSRGIPYETFYKYPNQNSSDPIILGMTNKNIIGQPVEIAQTTQNLNAVNLKTQIITYGLFSGNYLPKKVETKIGAATTFTTDFDFLTYDPRGNLLTYKEKNGLTTKLEYFGTADVGKVDLLKKRTTADGTTVLQTTSYDYQALVGVQGITDPNAKTINFDYDSFNRLQTVKNPSGTARASYCYNYAGQVVDCATLAPTGSIAASALVLLAEASAPPLPVGLIDFDAVRVEKIASLSWSTSHETNSSSFDIERSKDGKQWLKIGSLTAQGESSSLQNYFFSDKSPLTGENLYRLKMLDVDGTFTYSRIRNVAFGNSAEVALYPNPVTIGEKLNIRTDALDKISGIQIFDTAGKLVDRSPAASEISTAKLAPGMYVVQITYTDGSISTHRVVKQ